MLSVGKISDVVAKQMSLVDNERYGEDDQIALQRFIEEIQSELDYQLSEIAPYDDEISMVLAKEAAIDLEALEALSRGSDEPVDTDKREKPNVGCGTSDHALQSNFRCVRSCCRNHKNIIKEQAINTGNEMENAGEALVWLVDYYKERM